MQTTTTVLMLAFLVTPKHAPIPVVEPEEVLIDESSRDNSRGISVWTDREDLATRGQRVRVFFEANEDTYVTVFRIDTDGRVSVLFPMGPWDHAFARGGRRYEVRPYSERYAFTANDLPGEGYVFATASPVPFDYQAVSAGARWEYEHIGEDGRMVGDPYVAVMELIDLVAPLDAQYPSYDVVPYYVDQKVEYPRFVCYECHGYLRAAAWDPYRDPCYKFRLTVYDDPSYYPARVKNGSRVVFTRSNRLEPRYVFTERIGSEPDIDVKQRRPENRTQRRPVSNRPDPNRVRNRQSLPRASSAATPRRLRPHKPTRRTAPVRSPSRVRRRVVPPDTSAARSNRPNPVRRRPG